MRLLGMLRRDALPVFVTLTYPRVWSSDYRQWKRNLDAFGHWLRRWSLGKGSAVWKLELQDRGAPHFHLMIYGLGFIPRLLLSRVWYRIVNSGDVNHLMAGTRVERIRSYRGVMSYASKRYMGKEWDSLGKLSVGRCWGVLNRSALPLSRRRVFYLDVAEANKVFRAVRKWGKLPCWSAYHVFSGCPLSWERLVLGSGGIESG